MSYFSCFSKEQKKKLFFIPPTERSLDNDKKTLSYSLGATLYMPGSSIQAVNKLIENKIPGLVSTVLCLEDAVDDRYVAHVEKNLNSQLKTLLIMEKKGSFLPFIFIRVRSLEQFVRLTEDYEAILPILSGFVFPKFDHSNGHLYFEQLEKINRKAGKTLYGMPILETPGVIHLEKRYETLIEIKSILDKYKELVLNLRIGVTDLSGLYGLRRSCELTIYDIAVIRDFIGALVNIFGRPKEGYVISGPVWEYFSSGQRILKSQLRQGYNQFDREYRSIREKLLCRYIDGLIREVMLDKANGLIGKTIIHPSHLLPVQALHAVTHEEYCDAKDILSNNNGGVSKSVYNNKMNEAKPHTYWAEKVLTLAKIYGVLNDKHDYTSIIYEGDKLQSIG
ncbi:conserved hypothetical protein [Desulfofarcimen acetoxidans DSM 771]|uniref:ATP/GTP-binding protein n=1 Tax=Desulfofarcimen acetoxidans (strain ATCC 49208 / DSM 771 / KCTC 5769 / VKM B-1644 / 5575) TaxID=485916 RepID=C8W644_DESAS|nr:HpcH/HpaI aldolase/citrate lyase family protein [Desulfofarcimen acetoxidans]ACV61499.1 conserved hypothetical protein [Desulfofarcimen acetoxidans DSM 771]